MFSKFFRRAFKFFWPSESKLRVMYRLGVQAGRAQVERELKLVRNVPPAQSMLARPLGQAELNRMMIHPLERSPQTEPLKLHDLRRSGGRMHAFNAQRRTVNHLQHKGFQLPPARPGKPIELYATGLMPVPDIPGPDDAA